MAIPVISKTKKFISTLLTFWIPIKSYRRAFRGILQLGIKNYLAVLKNDKKTKFKTEIAIGAIMKNEGPYLQEWLEYHILVGIKKFYLYDNESTDNTQEILKPYIKKGIVEYTYFPGKRMQKASVLDTIDKHSKDTKWIAFIDLDEFIVPAKHKTVSDFLHTLPDNFAQLVVSWALYGSSGHIHKPNGMVIENYKHRAQKTYGIKSVINPRLVLEYTNPHANFIAGWTIDENGKKLGYINQSHNPPTYNKIRINHYITKSYDEYIERSKRGKAFSNYSFDFLLQGFKDKDKNEIYDDIMDKYIKKLKNKISG